MNILRRLNLGLLLLVVCSSFAFAQGEHASSEKTLPPSSKEVFSYGSEIAILSHTSPLTPLDLKNLRESLYRRPGIRLARIFYKITGSHLDSHPTLPALTVILLTLALLHSGYRLSPPGRKAIDGSLRRIFLWIQLSLFALGLVGGLLVLFDLHKLEEHDRRSPWIVQNYIDIFTAKGQAFKVFTNWREFEKDWKKNVSQGHAPYPVIAWAIPPRDFTPGGLRNWLHLNAKLPITHLSIGPALNEVFREQLFGANQYPRLEWTNKDASHASDPITRLSRPTAWVSTRDDERPTNTSIFSHNLVYSPNYTLPGEKDFNPELFLLWQQAFASLPALTISACLDRSAVLRMDDPGSAQGAYLESWRSPSLSTEAWTATGKVLRQFGAKASVGYVSGWLDDGDNERGTLWLNGKAISKRTAAEVLDSAQVRYYSNAVSAWYELEQQARYLSSYTDGFDVELHGHTHITPFVQDWLLAKNRYEEADWYREFADTRTRPHQPQAPEIQRTILKQGLERFNRTFSRAPSSLIPPGHKYSENTPELAQEAGLLYFSAEKGFLLSPKGIFFSRSLSTRDIQEHDDFSTEFVSTLLFHDWDISRYGVQWLEKELQAWKAKGIKRFISLRELAIRLQFSPTLTTEPKKLEARLEWSFSPLLAPHLSSTFPEEIDVWIHLPRSVWLSEVDGARILEQDPARNRIRLGLSTLSPQASALLRLKLR